jgi:hypothetical protein
MNADRNWMEKAQEAFERLGREGSLPARLRIRAEVLLEYHDEGEIELTANERERLERICAAPNDDDGGWLAQFDERL